MSCALCIKTVIWLIGQFGPKNIKTEVFLTWLCTFYNRPCVNFEKPEPSARMGTIVEFALVTNDQFPSLDEIWPNWTSGGSSFLTKLGALIMCEGFFKRPFSVDALPKHHLPYIYGPSIKRPGRRQVLAIRSYIWSQAGRLNPAAARPHGRFSPAAAFWRHSWLSW